MAKLSVKEIRDLGRQIVGDHPNGIRYNDLAKSIVDANPETPINTVYGAVFDLAARFPQDIAKPSRGLFMPAGARAFVPDTTTASVAPSAKVCEQDFYEPFANWLMNELDEVTVALPLGGAALGKKWGTPDVVGVYKPLASDRIKFAPEIVAAELKIDPQQPVVAFGQAAAYRLFASKSYVVVPNAVSLDDYNRLEALCMLFGIGLARFNPDKEHPNFEIRVRAQRFSPDMFYVNEFADGIHKMDPKAFDKLFG
ncbi:MAG TPA: hypothetical protein PKK06_09695 [Phycisphaerae bacterium]|nr:hypothetical protein [Phycisphaerae bacterium]HNU45573.1 hypothetical protein [Phycisphaerae bacterium]